MIRSCDYLLPVKHYNDWTTNDDINLGTFRKKVLFEAPSLEIRCSCLFQPTGIYPFCRPQLSRLDATITVHLTKQKQNAKQLKTLDVFKGTTFWTLKYLTPHSPHLSLHVEKKYTCFLQTKVDHSLVFISHLDNAQVGDHCTVMKAGNN